MRVVVIALVRGAVVLSQYDVLIFVIMVWCLFMFRQFKRVKYYQIKDNKSNQWSSICCRTRVISFLIICIGFESIHYTINLDVVSSFMVSNNFDSMFI